jgi:hypothetical protein
MMDILPMLGLPDPPQRRTDYYVPCPCCDHGRDKHLNIDLEKDVYRCPRCGISGGVFDLYSLYAGIPREQVFEDLKSKFAYRETPVVRKPLLRPETTESPLR